MYNIKVEKGRLSIVKGKMAAGKTMALLIDAKDYIDFELGALFFTLEQPSCKLLNKFFDKVKAKRLHQNYMHVVDMAMSLESIMSIIDDAKEKVEVIYIDSLEAIKVNKEVENKEKYIIETISKKAKEINLPIVITSQVSKENEENRDVNAIIDEIKALFKDEALYKDALKQIVARDFSGFESYDYFSANVKIVDNDNNVANFTSFNLSDYFNN